MEDRDVLRKGASDSIEGRELADPKGGDERRDAVDSGVAVGGIC